jgi:transposase InsO family protein
MILLRQQLLEDIVAARRKTNDVADILHVRRETISRWMAKYRFEGIDGISPKKPGPKKGSITINKTSAEVEDLICNLARHNPYKGPVGLRDMLEEDHHVQLHSTTIYRILKRNDARYGRDYHALKKKRKLYCLDLPGREMQLDVCFPFGYARRLVVYSIIDDCSRFCIAQVMDGHDMKTTIAFLEYVLARCPFPITAIRTDQGQEFSSEVTKFMVDHTIEHRKNPPYTPQHNGKVERYHRTFKEGEVYRWPFMASQDYLNYRLSLWVSFYNTKRRHYGLAMNGMTPLQKCYYATIQSSLQAESPYTKNVTGTLQQNID